LEKESPAQSEIPPTANHLRVESISRYQNFRMRAENDNSDLPQAIPMNKPKASAVGES
jgi:hypothetical protein